MEEEVAESRECDAVVVRRNIAPSNSGLKVLVDQGREIQGASSSSNVQDPVKELEKSKLFDVQNHLGFNFVLAEEELAKRKAMPDEKAQSSKASRESNGGCK
jgi:hypothetical protein